MMRCATFLLLLVPASAFLSEKVKMRSEIDAMEYQAGANQEAQWGKEVDALLKNMTLAEKIAQMLQVEANGVDMDTYLPFVGSVLYSGNHRIGDNSKKDWYAYAQKLQETALAGPHGVPIFIGSDSVHGQSHLKGTTIFPHNINLGCSRNKTLVEKVARATAFESAATGVNYIFAPCLDIVQDVRWGRTYESFSQDPQLVNELGAAFVQGAQSVDSGMLTSAKHFVAAGATKFGTGWFISAEDVQKANDDARVAFQKKNPNANLKHYDPKIALHKFPRKPLDRGNAELDHTELFTKHMLPYWGVVSAGTGSVMTSYSKVNGVPNHANAELLGYLKGKEGMNYDGFVITDYAGIDMIDKSYSIALPKAINAGIDMVMLPGTVSGCHPWQEGPCPTAHSFVKDMLRHVQTKRITEERINDAARRILMAKKKHGVFNQPLAPHDWLQQVGAGEHMQLAREAAQQGTVVLTNKGQALPLSKKDKICVAGEVADDLGMQLGGWSINWQGFKGKTEATGKTFWNAAQERLNTATYDATGKCEGADTVIAVVGEEPYAEGKGDAEFLTLRDADQKMLDNALQEQKKSSEDEDSTGEDADTVGRRVILITMSGRPLWMAKSIEKADAFVAAFVPGIMGGAGVLDVLLGEVAPTGKLSVAWPADDKVPVNEKSKPEDVLFALGAGETYDVVHQDL